MSKKWLHGELLLLISQQGPEIFSSHHFVLYGSLASIEVVVPISLKTFKVCLKINIWWKFYVKQSTHFWVIEQPPFYNVLFISQRPIKLSYYFFTVGVLSNRPFRFWFHFGLNGHFNDCIPWTFNGLKSFFTWLSDTKLFYIQNLTIIHHQGPELCQNCPENFKCTSPFSELSKWNLEAILCSWKIWGNVVSEIQLK